MLDKLKIDYLKSRKCNDIERKKTLQLLIDFISENISWSNSDNTRFEMIGLDGAP